MNRHRLFYLGLILIFGSILWFYISKGKALEINIFHSAHIENSNTIAAKTTSTYSPFIGFLNNIKSPFSLLILQIITIIIAARIFGYLLRKLYQPTVMGEIIAGIVLGPSLLGYFFPEIFHFIFPAESIINISFLSNIGLILFMFIIGWK